jgi:hypothetical protein
MSSSTMRNPFYFLYVPWLAVALGCGIGVGDPCIPEKTPPDGFDKTEAYLETGSAQCQSRVCGVFFYQGNPLAGAADPDEVQEKIYCTCRCDSPDQNFATCQCPDGFECREVLDIGGPGVQGSYCVRRGLAAR